MHGSRPGAHLRRICLVGVFMLVMLTLATHVTPASAACAKIGKSAAASPCKHAEPGSRAG